MNISESDLLSKVKLRKLLGSMTDKELSRFSRISTEILTEFREQREREQELHKERQHKADMIKKQMKEAGIALSDLLAETKAGKPKTNKFYVIGADGSRINWSGVGRKSKKFQEAIENGAKIHTYE